MVVFLTTFGQIFAEERLLYSDNFQGWTAAAASGTESSVTKTTDFTSESLTFKLMQIQVDPTKYDVSRFNYAITSTGALIANKMATAADPCYIELSPLKSITKIHMVVGATGSSRGYQVWKKADGDASWVSIYSAYANPTNGDSTTIYIPGNKTNVALKFTNLAYAQNAYLFDLKIYGEYTSTAQQVSLTTGLNNSNAGSVSKSPTSATYDINSIVRLTATRNFGYQFEKWINTNTGETLSTSNPFDLVMDGDKNVQAVFQTVQTYNFNVTTAGSQWGKVTLSPAPTNGKYETGTVVTATAIPNPVTNFSYWEDQTTNLVRTIQVDGDKSLTATFDEMPFIVGWDFKVSSPTSGRGGDYYAETSNVGSLQIYNQDGTTTSWLSNTGSFSPSYPCAYLWTAGTSFATNHRYFQASFSTAGYQNIRIKSMMAGSYQRYAIQTLQYSLDGTNFTELARVDITGSAWKDLNAILPAEAQGQSKVYLRWIADATSTLLGNATDNDGTAISNIFVYAEKLAVNDVTAPTLLLSVPAESATNASANGSIVLTFDEKMKTGASGDCTLGSTILTSSFGSKTVSFPYTKLAYNTDYTFTVPAGALTDMSGNAFAGITIHFRTMNRPQPIAKAFDFVVAQDGSGNGTTIQSAFDAVPVNNGSPFLIFVKNGTYNEYPSLASTKKFVRMIGQSQDGVIITGAHYSGLVSGGVTYTTSNCQTLELLASDFYGENLTIKNTSGLNAGQAVALKAYGDRCIFKNVKLTGFQDTHLTGNGRQLYQKCDIRGSVDFIFGGGDVFFDDCQLYCEARSGGDVITAPSTTTASTWGYVFNGCTVDGDATTQNNTYLLGRPWQNAPRSIYINTKMNIMPVSEGWTNMGVIPALFAEYNSMTASGQTIDLSNRRSSFTTSGGSTTSGLQTVLTTEQASQYTMSNVLTGTDSWDPTLLTETTEAPANVKMNNGTLSWDATNYAICYTILRDYAVIGFTTNNSFSDNAYSAAAQYSVIAVAESGALSGKTKASGVTTDINSAIGSKITAFCLNGNVHLSNLPAKAKLETYSFNGKMLTSYQVSGTSITIPLNENNVIIRIISANETSVLKVSNR